MTQPPDFPPDFRRGLMTRPAVTGPRLPHHHGAIDIITATATTNTRIVRMCLVRIRPLEVS